MWAKLFKPILIIQLDLHIVKDAPIAEAIALGVVFIVVWLISLGMVSLYYAISDGGSEK